MGYDVTFHAISKSELKKYVFDVLDDPSLAAERSKNIDENEDNQEYIQSIYDNMLQWISSSPQKCDDFAETFSFAIAAISGYLHDFYYSRNFALSFIEGEHRVNFLKSFNAINDSPLSNYRDVSGGAISSNYSGSGFSDEPKAILEFVENHELAVDEDALDSLKRSLNYCIDNDLLFIEASDLVVPFTNESYTNTSKMKAHFLDNITS